MFNVTTGVYESHHSPFSETSATVRKQESNGLDFQAFVKKADSDIRAASPKISDTENVRGSSEAVAKLKSNETVHQYEPLPEGCRAPKVCWFVNETYCEARGPGSDAWQPDWEAAQAGRTIGRLGDTDGWGNPVLWSDARRAMLSAGEVFATPAGKYQVVTNKWGDLVLRPLDDAWRSAGETFRSLTGAGHHIGVHPKPGEVWYQAQAQA